MASKSEVGLERQLNSSISNPSPAFNTQLLLQEDNHENKPISEIITTHPKEIYGHPSHPIKFRTGNGGAGYTGLLQVLLETYIQETRSDFRIAWVSNHSRHSQLALLAGVVQIVLTYEPENEELSIREGWAERVCRAFNDHFLLVGPEDVELRVRGIGEAFRAIAESQSNGNGKGYRFHSRGDGSATFGKEQKIWNSAGVDVQTANWIETYPLVPYEALRKAEEEGAFLLTDRSTFLTAKRDGIVPSLKAHVEDGAELMNPCSALVGSPELVDRLGEGSESHDAARLFAIWLGGERAQEIIRRYGMDWAAGKALFTTGDKDEFDEQDRLVSSLE